MILHLDCELPDPSADVLDESSPDLTLAEVRILKTQIRKNGALIHDYVMRLDLLLNKERYPQRAVFIKQLRRRLQLLMEENDTFRRVLWKYFQHDEVLAIPMRAAHPRP